MIAPIDPGRSRSTNQIAAAAAIASAAAAAAAAAAADLVPPLVGLAS